MARKQKGGVLGFFAATALGAIIRNSVMLASIGIGTTLLIAVTHEATRERIAQERQAARLKALREIVPEAATDPHLEDNILMVRDALLGYEDAPRPLWRVRRGNAVSAVVLTAIAPDGYTEAIELLVGVDAGGTVRGVRAVRHKETPGLGDKIELRKDNWILGFDGTSLRRPTGEQWGVKKDGGVFDALTGATVTPRAVVAAVKRTLQYTERNRRRLFALPEDE